MEPPVNLSGQQKNSLYHTEVNIEFIKKQLLPYARLFSTCSSVLDIGCGPGIFFDLLPKSEAKQYIGLDIDFEMARITRSKGYHAACITAETIACLRTTFDGIHAGHIIEHLSGDAALRFIKTCHALLKPGGIFLVRTPNWENELVRTKVFWLEISHVRPYPVDLLVQLFRDQGFGGIKTLKENTRLEDIAVTGIKL